MIVIHVYGTPNKMMREILHQQEKDGAYIVRHLKWEGDVQGVQVSSIVIDELRDTLETRTLAEYYENAPGALDEFDGG